MQPEDIRGRKGNLFVISGPSGAGKGTLLERALPQVQGAWNSISCTTRAPRGHEVDGREYHFMTEGAFIKLRDEGGLLEWAQVHDHFYGTPRRPAEEHIAAGYQVILEIDVQGAMQVRQSYPAACLIFIAPPSLEELERRLIGRGTETPDEVQVRLGNARTEMGRRSEYDYVIVNDDITRASDELVSLMEARARGSEER
jgi:guanylate kinase